MEWIPVVTKTYRLLLSKGRNVEIEEVRKWFQPLMPGLGDRIDDLLSLESLNKLIEDALPEGPWQPAVALSQTLLLLGVPGIDIEELDRRIGLLLKVWDENPVNYSALLSELRRRTISLGKPDGSIVETLTFDPQKPSYFSSEYSESGTDFFLNYLRFDEGIDVDALLDPLRKLLEKDPLVEDFLRLTGIDLLLKPSDFVSRIDRAVDIFLKAKEQGLDPEKILKKWDELANNGGDRFVYLEEAVKRVASEEINSSFWKAVEEYLTSSGSYVMSMEHHQDPSVVKEALSLGLVGVGARGVVLTDDFKTILENTFTVLRKVEPAPLYSMGDFVRILRTAVLSDSLNGREALLRSQVLSGLSPTTLRLLLSDENYLKVLKEAIRKTVLRGFSVDKFVEAVERSLGSVPTSKTFFNVLMENVHKEEGV